MKDPKNIFRNVEKKLTQASWFDADWRVYNRGAYLQLYKSGWHNHNQGGIHFETYIEKAQLKQKAIPILMHAEEDCPSQPEFIKRFLELEGDRIKRWKGYKINGTGYSIIQKILPLNFKNLEQRLFEELNHLRCLEGAIDKTLSSLGEQPKSWDSAPPKN